MPVATDVLAPVIRRTLAQVRAALRLVHDSPTARSLAQETGTEPDPDGALGHWLYSSWWCGLERSPQPPVGTAPQAYAVLEAARRTVATVDPGWLVLAVSENALVGANLHTRERATVRADGVVGSSRPGLPPRPGDLVSLLSGTSGIDPEGAWWWATTTHRGLPEGPVHRWYVHPPDLDAALSVVPRLLELLAGTGVEASLKCPPVAELYGRRDALVVYLPRDQSATAEAALAHRADDYTALSPEIPPLTRELIPGIGAAHDPGNGISYGQLRCAQLALLSTQINPDCPDSVLLLRLTALGIDPAKPEVLA